MATNYNSKIVTDGLVLCLDAANPKSYPGSGTTWSDLSGNGNNGTLVNGVGYNANNKGSLTFDGVNDYTTLGNPSLLIPLGSVTICSWIYPSSVATIKTIFSRWSSGNQRSYKIALLGGKFYLDVSNVGNEDIYRTTTTTLSLNAWYYVSGVYTSGASSSIDVYINSILDNGTLTGTIPSSLYTGTSTVYVGTDDTNVFSGRISNIQMYNRALSATEIQQNFNATRSRYGI